MFQKIIEYIFYIVVIALLSELTWSYLFSGEWIKIIVGLILAFIVGSGVFILSLREIFYCISKYKKDDQ